MADESVQLHCHDQRIFEIIDGLGGNFAAHFVPDIPLIDRNVDGMFAATLNPNSAQALVACANAGKRLGAGRGMIGVIDVILLTAISTLGAFLYNLVLARHPAFAGRPETLLALPGDGRAEDPLYRACGQPRRAPTHLCSLHP